MPYISNSDLESRIKAARKRREQQLNDYIKGATEVAGWETGTSNAAAAEEEERLSKRSNWEKIRDKGKEIGSGIADTYKDLGNTLGTISYELTAGRDDDDKYLEAQKESWRMVNEFTKIKNDPNKTPEQRAHAEKAIASIKNDIEVARERQAEDDKRVEDLSVKDTAADLASVTADVLSAGTYGAAARGARTGRVLRAGTATKTVLPAARTVMRGAGTGAAANVAGQIPQELLDEEEGMNLKRLGTQAGLGAVLGGIGTGVSVRSNNRAARAAEAADRQVIEGVDAGMDDVARGLDAEDRIRADLDTTNKPLQLDAGQGRIERRMAEIDEELDGLRKGETDPNAYSTNPEDIRSLEGEVVSGKVTKSGEPYKNTKSPAYAETRGATIADSSDTATRARELMRERKALQTEMEGLDSVQRFDNASAPKMDVDDPQFRDAVDNELQAVDNSMTPPKFKDKPTGKVNALVDYFRTPTKVLRKIGLTDTADVVEKSFEKYRKDLMVNMKTINSWSKRVPEAGASQRIFNYLDGQDIRLTGEELKVATEMRSFLEDWADKLNLPKESRVSDYITHIFEGDFDGKTTDVTLNSILDKTGTTKSYNPFTQKRLGKAGYKEDAFAALDAYVKKSTRQLHMSDALAVTADAAKNVDDRTARYLLKLNQSIAMKPDKFEQIMNDVAASIPGVENKFGDRAATRAMRGWRNTVYRATLGLNVGSAVRNLTQGTNTFAELGGVRTLQGYTRIMRTFAEALKQKSMGREISAWDELYEHGILGDAFHAQDRTWSAVKDTMQKVDTGLWAMFDTAEKINRGAAYYAAKAKGLAKKMSEEEAIEYARDVVGKTQFRFNDVETPLILRSQVAKTLGQFQSFNVKQAEFLGGIAKGSLKGETKEMAKAIRWVGANIAMASTIGTLLGIKWTDAIPDFGTFRGVRSPLLEVGKNVKNVVTGTNEYGQEEDRGELAMGAAKDLFGLTVPGGTQAKKTAEGIAAVDRGGSVTDSGKLRYTIEDSPENRLRAGLFGQYSLDEGQEYFDQGREAFSEKQTEIIGDVPSGEEQAYETFFRNMSEKRDSKLNTGNKIREEVKNKNFAKAKRIADAHNAAVEEELAALSGKVGRPSRDIVDYIRSTYKVNFEYYKRNRDEE